MKTKLLICGRSGSGKDFWTNYLCNKYGLKQLLSYSTRPIRYDNEDTHVFINEYESKIIQSTQNIIAYTKIGEYEYFGTYEQLMESDIYIVDPNGIEYIKKNYEQKLLDEGIDLITIYISTDDDIRVVRAMNRCDDIRVYNQRCIDEAEQFDKFEDDMSYDFVVRNDRTEVAESDLQWIMDLYGRYFLNK